MTGEGNHTLVFMAGSGAPTPIIDYKPFVERFEDDYRIVIIEKFGYGFSDEFDGSRDVKTRVDQNRKALGTAGIPDIPTLLIISNGTITAGWIDFEMDYASGYL